MLRVFTRPRASHAASQTNSASIVQGIVQDAEKEEGHGDSSRLVFIPDPAAGRPYRATRGMLGLLALALSVLAGCGGNSTGVQSGGTLVFGAPVSKTGSLSHEGTDTLNGYNLWAKTVNAKGGITIGGKSYQVSIKSYDDASDANKSKQLTTQLITSDKVNFLLGPYGTTATLADETVALQYKIPMVEGNGAATSIFSQGNSYLFGVLSTAPHYGQTMIDAAASITTNGPENHRDHQRRRLLFSRRGQGRG